LQAELDRASGIGNPAISHVVYAAIAFTDALTTTFAGHVNQRDLDDAITILREALGNRFPHAQEVRLRTIFSERDGTEHGAELKTLLEAERLLDALAEFAAWAEGQMTAGVGHAAP